MESRFTAFAQRVWFIVGRHGRQTSPAPIAPLVQWIGRRFLELEIPGSRPGRLNSFGDAGRHHGLYEPRLFN